MTEDPFDRVQLLGPGVLVEEVLREAGVTQASFARAARLSQKHISRVINGHASITPEFALLLEEALGWPECPSAEYWCALQAKYDLAALRANTVHRGRQRE